MIEGYIDRNGVPTIELFLAERLWYATIDTGFNGDLELPYELERIVRPKYRGIGRSDLAGARVVFEEEFDVWFPFDGRTVQAVATFSPGDGILIGTKMLLDYELHIDFSKRTVLLTRADEA